MTLLSQLTLEEKAALCLGSTFWHTAPIPRLGIPAIMVADGPHGLRRQPDGRYTAAGNAGTDGATQAAQALALDAGLVPADSRGKVLDALVELIYAFHPNGAGPHFSGGTIGMGPIVRALMNGDRDDVLWEILQQDDQPSYGYFLEPTPANPGGMTTIGERRNRGDSKNHMILAQIEEWFHAGIAGIQAAPGSLAYDRLVFKPKPVGDLTKASGSYETPAGWARSAWTKKDGRFALSVTVPANTQAEVWVPAADKRAVAASSRAMFLRSEGAYVVYAVASGSHSFIAKREI